MQTHSENESAGASLRHAWYAVGILTLANVSGFVDRVILSLLIEPVKRDMGISDFQQSLLAGLGFVFFYSVLALPIGRLVDRRSRRAIVGAGVALWSLFTMLTGAARNITHMFVARIGVGVGEATLGPAAISIVGDAFPSEKRSFAMGVFSTAIFVGSGLAYFLGAQIVGAVDSSGTVTLPVVGTIFQWQRVFFYLGIPGLVIALLAFFMPEPKRRAVAENIPVSEVWAYFRSNSRTMLGLSLGFGASAAVNWAMSWWLASFFIRTHGWTATKAGSYMGILTMTLGVVGALLGGRIADRWAKQGRTDAPLRVAIIAAIGMICTAGMMPLVSTDIMSAALLVPANVFAAMPWGAASAAVANVLPSRIRGQGSAMYQMITNMLGGIVGPSLVGFLTDKVFRDPLALRYSLSICIVSGMAITIALLSWGRSAYVRTAEQVRNG